LSCWNWRFSKSKRPSFSHFFHQLLKFPLYLESFMLKFLVPEVSLPPSVIDNLLNLGKRSPVRSPDIPSGHSGFRFLLDFAHHFHVSL
jgi:hypothetical protein